MPTDAPLNGRCHILARRDGPALVLALLMGSGDICRDCGSGTRATSKRRRKCRKCGARWPRRAIEDVGAEMWEKLEERDHG